MDVKEAANVAKVYLADLYMDEGVTNLGLEEVVFDDVSGNWEITIGFSRPWDRQTTLPALVGARSDRTYKVVRIDGQNGDVISLKDRLLAPRND
jgi:hypothetical protein